MMSKRSLTPYIIVCGAVLLCLSLMVYPTYDDWCYLISPNFDKHFWKFFLPYGDIWRPFDALLGYVVAINTRLFPALNHVLIVVGHTLGGIVFYHILRRIGVSLTAQWVSSAFFMLSPCMLGTVLSCDAFNQVYSSTWGLLAVWSYLSMGGKRRYVAWIVCVFLAVLSKENGLAWAVVPPILAFSFNKIDRQTLLKHLFIGAAIAALYGIIRLSLPQTEAFNAEYHTFLLSKKIKDVCLWIGYTWVAADYISIFHAPSRNLLLFGATLILSLPMLYMLFVRSPKVWTSRPFWGICVCIIITASPNLLINMSVMNAYSSLAMAALLVAYCTDGVAKEHPQTVKTAFVLYLAACFMTDIHHIYKAITTSNVGKEMAREVIKQTGKPVKNVLCVIVNDDERKFSSFCVLPQDAFGANASAVVHETKYQWPKAVKDTIVTHNDAFRAAEIALQAVESGSYDCAWIINKQEVKVVRKSHHKQ